MGVLATDNRQLIYIYSEASLLGVNVLTNIKTIDRPKRIINVNEESISKTIWLEISGMIGCELQDLFNPDYSISATVNDSNELSVGDWLKVIEHSPEILQQPIVIDGTNAKIITQESDIYNCYDTTVGNHDKLIEGLRG